MLSVKSFLEASTSLIEEIMSYPPMEWNRLQSTIDNLSIAIGYKVLPIGEKPYVGKTVTIKLYITRGSLGRKVGVRIVEIGGKWKMKY